MPLELLTETSDFLPFATTPGDWFNCYYLPGDVMVYIHHPLIIALMKHRGEAVIDNPPVQETDGARWAVNAGENYSNYANGLGNSIGRWLDGKPERRENTAVQFFLPDFPFPMCCGLFGEQTFVWKESPASDE